VEEHYVGVKVGAHDGQVFTIGGVGVEADGVIGEICDLMAGGAVERLQPQVVGAVVVDDIGDRLAVAGELGIGDEAWIGIEELDLRVGACVERDDGELAEL